MHCEICGGEDGAHDLCRHIDYHHDRLVDAPDLETQRHCPVCDPELKTYDG